MFSPLHLLQKLRGDTGRSIEARPTKWDAVHKRIGEFSLSLLLHYKLLLLAAWIAAIIFLLVFEILLTESTALNTGKE